MLWDFKRFVWFFSNISWFAWIEWIKTHNWRQFLWAKRVQMHIPLGFRLLCSVHIPHKLFTFRSVGISIKRIPLKWKRIWLQLICSTIFSICKLKVVKLNQSSFWLLCPTCRFKFSFKRDILCKLYNSNKIISGCNKSTIKTFLWVAKILMLFWIYQITAHIQKI